METTLDPLRFQETVQGIYRLFRVATFHDLANEAVSQAIEQCLRSLRVFADANEGVTMLFARDTVIVNGQLLRAPPAVYELAMEFGAFLTATRVNSLFIAPTAANSDIRKLLEYFHERTAVLKRAEAATGDFAIVPDNAGFIAPAVRVRRVEERLLLGLEDPRLSAFERIMLTYALAVRVVRTLMRPGSGGETSIPAYFKRVARQLALVNYADRPRLLDVVLGRGSSIDPARDAVAAAVVAAAMTRRLTQHESVLARISLTAMLSEFGVREPEREAARDSGHKLAVASAAAHIRLGGLRQDAVERAIVAFEVHALRAGLQSGRVYRQRIMPSLDAWIVAVARTFVERLSHSGGESGAAFDEAVLHLRRTIEDPVGRACVDLLTSALGLIVRGDIVELQSGARGVVVRSGSKPSMSDRPHLLLVRDPSGRLIQPLEADLDVDAVVAKLGRVVRVVVAADVAIEPVRVEVLAGEIDWYRAREQYVGTFLDGNPFEPSPTRSSIKISALAPSAAPEATAAVAATLAPPAAAPPPAPAPSPVAAATPPVLSAPPVAPNAAVVAAGDAQDAGANKASDASIEDLLAAYITGSYTAVAPPEPAPDAIPMPFESASPSSRIRHPQVPPAAAGAGRVRPSRPLPRHTGRMVAVLGDESDGDGDSDDEPK